MTDVRTLLAECREKYDLCGGPTLRVGPKVGRTVYLGHDPDDLIGVMDTREFAAAFVTLVNAFPQLAEALEQLDEECERRQQDLSEVTVACESLTAEVTALREENARWKAGFDAWEKPSGVDGEAVLRWMETGEGANPWRSYEMKLEDELTALREELWRQAELNHAAEESRAIWLELAEMRNNPGEDLAELLGLLEDHLRVTPQELLAATADWPRIEREALARLWAAIRERKHGD